MAVKVEKIKKAKSLNNGPTEPRFCELVRFSKVTLDASKVFKWSQKRSISSRFRVI